MLANHVKHKEPERQGLAKQVEEFLKQGNKIQVIKSSEDPRPSKKTHPHEFF